MALATEQVVGDVGLFTPLHAMDYSIPELPEGEFNKLQKKFEKVMVKHVMSSDELSYEKFLQSCPGAQEFVDNFHRLYSIGGLGDAGQGRIVDPSLDVADWMAANRNATEFCVALQRLDEDRKFQGAAHQDGVRHEHHMVLQRGRDVLAVVDRTAASTPHTVIRFDMLLLCCQLPHACTGVPIGFYVDENGRAHTLWTFTTASYNLWPQVIIDKEPCCVMQLLGLIQFSMIPRHPQEKGNN
jgi:hypothetical protein